MYERTATIERATDKPVSNTGKVSGILATSGEASDGHILNVQGGDLKRGTPLLFNHDAFDGNLGSWVDFEKSEDMIRGTAQIELDGIGEKADWRNDVAFMVDQGHIPGFSIRWDATKPPTRRVDLAKDHPAYVNAEKEQDFAKLYGLYFDKWRMLEGSIVTLPADQGALIGRMRDGKAGARKHWSRILERMAGLAEDESLSHEVLESFDKIGLDELEPVELADGRTFFVPHELAETLSHRMSEMPSENEVSETPLEMDVSAKPVQVQEDASASSLQRADISELIREGLAPMYEEIREEWRELLYRAFGRI